MTDEASGRHDSKPGRTAARKRRSDLGMPRWGKPFGIAAVTLIAIVVILHLTGNGFHGHSQ